MWIILSAEIRPIEELDVLRWLLCEIDVVALNEIDGTECGVGRRNELCSWRTVKNNKRPHCFQSIQLCKSQMQCALPQLENQIHTYSRFNIRPFFFFPLSLDLFCFEDLNPSKSQALIILLFCSGRSPAAICVCKMWRTGWARMKDVFNSGRITQKKGPTGNHCSNTYGVHAHTHTHYTLTNKYWASTWEERPERKGIHVTTSEICAFFTTSLTSFSLFTLPAAANI